MIQLKIQLKTFRLLLVKSIPLPRRRDTFQEFTTRENYSPKFDV